MPGPPPTIDRIDGDFMDEAQASPPVDLGGGLWGERRVGMRARNRTVQEGYTASYETSSSDEESGGEEAEEWDGTRGGGTSAAAAGGQRQGEAAAGGRSQRKPSSARARVSIPTGNDSTSDSSESGEESESGSSTEQEEQPAARRPGKLRAKMSSKSQTQQRSSQLDRKAAVAAARDWYNQEGPFAGQYKMMAPLEAYRNDKNAWSLKYLTSPDAGGLFFVRFEYEQCSGGDWLCAGFSQLEPSDELDEDGDDSEDGKSSSEEEEDWRARGESKAAKARKLHQAKMKAAKAERKAGSASERAAKKQKLANITRDQEDMAKKRMEFLMKRADVFGQFLGKSAVKVKQASGASSPSRRHRMTEKQEDNHFEKQQQLAAEEEKIPRMSPEMTRAFISFGQMRDYQVEGLNWMIRLYHRGLNGILADEMGLGKTLQTISLLGYLHTYKNIQGPHLIVVPKSTLGNWDREFGRWFPKLRVLKFHGDKVERELLKTRDMVYDKFDVLLTTYEMIIAEKAALSRFFWEYLIVDEAHRLKNENSYDTKCRMLVTGTPLQNNLHELWALLNFLLPDVFSDSELFEKYSNAAEDEKQDLISQLHKVLKPFILRRLKIEVEKGLPPKKELVVYCRMTAPQRRTYAAVLKSNVEVLNGMGAEKTKLQNIVMQLRKACNHPCLPQEMYLFDGVEDKTLDPFGEHLVKQSGKLLLLDKLLPRLKAQGSRVLIFSQMTRVLDILEDYCYMRGHQRCRLDGQTGGPDRDRIIDEYNAPDSSKFIFLLSTRAGGLGITLTSADVVVLYDSDWNPQMDLQAQDRAHRIGQTKPVKVFRLITEHTVEEKILERAMKKLHLDALVIQQGRLADDNKKSSTKGELAAVIRYGADGIFKANETDDDDAEIDIDAILEKAEKKTNEINEKFAVAKSEGAESKMWNFDGVEEEADVNALAAIAAAGPAFVDIGKRVRKQVQKFGIGQSSPLGDDAIDDPFEDNVSPRAEKPKKAGKRRRKVRSDEEEGDWDPKGKRSFVPGSKKESRPRKSDSCPGGSLAVSNPGGPLKDVADDIAGRWIHLLTGSGASNFGDRKILSRTDPALLRTRLWHYRTLLTKAGGAYTGKVAQKPRMPEYSPAKIMQQPAMAQPASQNIQPSAASGADPERDAYLLQHSLSEFLIWCSPRSDVVVILRTTPTRTSPPASDGANAEQTDGLLHPGDFVEYGGLPPVAGWICVRICDDEMQPPCWIQGAAKGGALLGRAEAGVRSLEQITEAAPAGGQASASNDHGEHAGTLLHDYMRKAALSEGTSKKQQESVLLACDLLRGKVEGKKGGEKRADLVPVPKERMKEAFKWALGHIEMHALGTERYFSKRMLINAMQVHDELRETYKRRHADKKQYLSSWAKASLNQCMGIEIDSGFCRWMEKDPKYCGGVHYYNHLKHDHPASKRLNAIMTRLGKKECKDWMHIIHPDAKGKVCEYGEPSVDTNTGHGQQDSVGVAAGGATAGAGAHAEPSRPEAAAPAT